MRRCTRQPLRKEGRDVPSQKERATAGLSSKRVYQQGLEPQNGRGEHDDHGIVSFHFSCLLRWIERGAIPVSIPKIQEGPEKTASLKPLKLVKRNEKINFDSKSTGFRVASAEKRCRPRRCFCFCRLVSSIRSLEPLGRPRLAARIAGTVSGRHDLREGIRACCYHEGILFSWRCGFITL